MESMNGRKRLRATLTRSQWEEILFAVRVNREIYLTNPGRAYLARRCEQTRESILRQLSKPRSKR